MSDKVNAPKSGGMRPRAVRKAKVRGLLAAILVGGTIAAIVGAPESHAMPDPYVPNPPFWCPGNNGGLSSSGYGGYCEGKTFPDGSRLNVFRVGYFWQPIRCIIPDGTPFPPLAGPSGCAGLLG